MRLHSPVYRDFWVKIIGCLVISEIIDAMGREDSFFQRLGSKYFYFDLLSGFFIALLLWEVTRFAIIRLDRRYDWLEKPFQRIALQLVFCIAVPAALSFVFTATYMKLAYKQDIFQTSWLYSEFYTVILFIVFVNVIYFTWWLYLKWKSQPTDEIKMVANNSNGHSILEVTRAGKKILLQHKEVACAYLSNGYCYIRPFEGEVFVTNYSLDELARLLDEYNFFRVNRQTLISRKSCSAYKSIENGKIELEIVPPLKNPVIVSQKRASDFRKWIVLPLASVQI